MLKGIAKLTWRQRYDLVVTLALAVVVEVGIRVLPLPTLTGLLRVPLQTDARDDEQTEQSLALDSRSRRRLQIISRVMRHWPFDEKCLRRSLVAAVRIRHVNPSLVIGVAIKDGEIKAHAWLRVRGVDLDPIASSFGQLQPLGPVRQESA